MYPLRFLLASLQIASFLQESEQGKVRSSLVTSRKQKCDCVCGVGSREERVVGGRKAKPREFPWIGMLSYGGTFYCGATLLTPTHLLTAAHCLYGRKREDVRVTLGEYDRNRKDDGKEEVRGVKKVSLHEKFDLARIEHDIAILELDRAVDITAANIRTACLPSQVGVNYTGSEGVVAGWGRLSEKGWTSGTLRKVSIPLISRQQCSTMGYPPERITDHVFCAVHPKGKKDACQGDSGGPIHLNGTNSHEMEIIGVVSWGKGCGRPNYPGVYTRVDHYLDWIEQHLDDQCLCRHPDINNRQQHPKAADKPRRWYNSWG